MKFIFSTILSMAGVLSFAQTNLINVSTWETGENRPARFAQYGQTDGANNSIIVGTGPNNNTVLLWKAMPTTTSNRDGGWVGNLKPIDISKSYRFTVWVKKSNSFDGRVLFGVRSFDSNNTRINDFTLNNQTANSSYFVNGNLPSLDEWYLLVGYIHNQNHTGTTVESKVFDVFGNEMSGSILNDYKFAPGTSQIRELVLQNQSDNVDDSMYFYGPTLYEINNEIPSIQEILNPELTTTTLWDSNSTGIHFNNGDVAIGRSTVPDGYLLAVDGHVRAREMRVDQDTWPDYVFSNDYKLPSLEEIQTFINKNGHLPNIPSADEVEQSGIEIGEMNKRLLEKIEELTLYILQQEERIKELEKNNK